MFYKNLIKKRNTTEKLFEFDMFKKEQNPDDSSQLKVGETKLSYNFISEDGSLRSGYGFKDVEVPTSETDLENERQLQILGNEVFTIWKLKWYNYTNDTNCYYLFYYNDNNEVCYDSLFQQSLGTFHIPTQFTQPPYITNYRNKRLDAILLSGKDENALVIYGNGTKEEGTAPSIISCCNHYGKLFAITGEARGGLVYNDALDIVSWDNALTKNLDFGDPRGDLNKVISFDDYVYVFRDHGITQISEYSTNKLLAVSHMYKTDGFIYPKTIVEYGDKVYFLEGNSLKVFNGNGVKDISIKSLEILEGQANHYACAEIYDGKYYLACRGRFDDETEVGCEANDGGYCNNMLLVYDLESGHVDILRGVDIRQMLALTTHLKSKLVACFYNQNKGRIGQLTTDGNLFGNKLQSCWKSGKTDFNMPGERKRMKHFLISTQADVEIKIASDEREKTYIVKGKSTPQKILANICGKEFEVSISSLGGDDYITNFVVTVAK